MRIGKLPGTMAQSSIGLQERKSHGVVDGGLYVVRAQVSRELVSLRMLDRIKMIDVVTVGSHLRYDDVFDLIEAGIIYLCFRPPSLRPPSKMRQLCRKDGGLQAVQTTVDSLDTMLMFDQATVPRQRSHSLGKIRATGNDC